MRIKVLLLAILVIFVNQALGYSDSASSFPDQCITCLVPQLALPIGIKIWFNECGGNVEGLTTWNNEEDFASLGIGHFVWHAYPSKLASMNHGFPALINYMKSRGVEIPRWLNGNNLLYCPWSNRVNFLEAKNSTKMLELRIFLRKTIPIQAEYIAKNLQKTLPLLLSHSPPQDQQLIYKKFCTLAKTPSGMYALIDYLNFKGAGLSNDPKNYEHGSGLLQVLRGMAEAPSHYTPLIAYVWSAKKALTRRVMRASPKKKYETWLAGWFKRLDTYLEGDLVNLQVAP